MKRKATPPISPDAPDSEESEELIQDAESSAGQPTATDSKPLTGTERVFGKDGLKIPDPVVWNDRREERPQEDAPDFPLPATLRAAFQLQAEINREPNSPTKHARLQRIGKHIARLSNVPSINYIPKLDLHPDVRRRHHAVGDDAVAAARNRIVARLKKKS